MRKCLIIVLALSMITGFAMAQDAEDEGIGLTVGLEFGIENANEGKGKDEDDADRNPYLLPNIMYENSFLDGALDLSAYLDYKFGFSKQPTTLDGDDKIQQTLYFDFFVGYNLGLTDSSTLSFLVENELEFYFAPKYFDDDTLKFYNDISDNIWGVVRPGILFNQNVENAGDFYGQVDVPIMYLWGDPTDDTAVGLDITAGWGSTFGLGFKAKVHLLVAPSGYDEIGFTGIDLTASFTKDAISAGVELRIPKEMNTASSYIDGSSLKSSVAIIPSFSYSFDFGLGIYANCAIGNIGGSGDVKVTPAIGVTYSF